MTQEQKFKNIEKMMKELGITGIFMMVENLTNNVTEVRMVTNLQSITDINAVIEAAYLQLPKNNPICNN